jgi:hypothetical protein
VLLLHKTGDDCPSPMPLFFWHGRLGRLACRTRCFLLLGYLGGRPRFRRMGGVLRRSCYIAIRSSCDIAIRTGRLGGSSARINFAGDVSAMLLDARQIVVVGRHHSIGPYNAIPTAVPLVADAGGCGEIIELLVLPVRALVLKSRHQQRNSSMIMLQFYNYPSIV